MSIIDNADVIAEKALATYINAIDYTSLTDIEAVEIIQALINNKDYINAKIISDYFIANGLPFGRSSIVPFGTVYAKGQTPSVYLKFAYLLKRLYQYNQDLSYDTVANNFLTELNTYMVINSGNYNTSPLSTAVLLFDNFGNINLAFRSGTYLSDINIFSWYLYGYDITEQVNFLFDAQNNFKTSLGTEGLFTPSYVRNLPENFAYGSQDTFVFNGCLGNDTDMFHQYETGLNLVKYYFYRYKQNSDRDNKAKAILEKYLNYLNSQTVFYGQLNYTSINTDSSSINTDMGNITTDSLYNYTLSGTADLGDLCRIGMTAVYKYLIDFEDETYNLATSIYNDIIALQQEDGSIYESSINIINQSLALQFISLYNNINVKSYYDIINSALRLYNLPEINDNNASIHEENYVLEACRIGMESILGDRFYGFAYTNTALPWVEGQYSWHLPDYNISMHRIGVVDYYITNPGKLYEPFLFNFQDWKRYFDLNPTLIGLPLRYAINTGYSINPGQNTIQNQSLNETLYVYPIPDKDYQINVVSYKLEPYISDFNQTPAYLPAQWWHVLKYFIAYKIGVNRGSGITPYWENKYAQMLRLLEYWDSTGNNSIRTMPSNFSFGKGGGNNKFSGFTPWEGQG